MRRKLAAGNWKMNGLSGALEELKILSASPAPEETDILVCPPSTLLSRAADLTKRSDVAVGGQDCHPNPSGAHTGDVSAQMLADAGASAVIIGHSERRQDHNEIDKQIQEKARAAVDAGLIAIVCVGESLSEREAGDTLDVIGKQLSGSIPDGVTGETLVVAYEPIWAIGTGKVPTIAQIHEVHDFVRGQLLSRFGIEVGEGVRLLYGGSVKPNNATDIFAVANVDGALVGGASLKAADFRGIIDALGAA
ncbi:triose-phosphate isomerase [Pseudopelagicola sp. nBUS_20]|uniref:triose-phosphate isomerase n=1 Tax=Pseudopelagicola sp. nBUS_20 TaxID=3395317 RepID=UPI003EBF292B